MTDAPRAHLDFAPARVTVENLPGGGFILRSPMALEPYASNLCEYLIQWAGTAPERTFLAERVNGGAKRDHRGGVKRDQLASAGLSP